MAQQLQSQRMQTIYVGLASHARTFTIWLVGDRGDEVNVLL